MKAPFLRLVFLLMGMGFISFQEAAGQIISNIRHEPFRDKVLITYMINGLTAQQRMEVNVYCSDDEFKNGLRSVSGNGVLVTGNGEKTIIWDVLKDRKKLVGTFSFELRGLVSNDNTSTASINASTVAVAMTVEEKKSAAHAEIASTLGQFIIEAKDLVIAFRGASADIFQDNLSQLKITDAIAKYNQVFNKLNSERMSYEKQVLTYWNNEALYNDVRYLFDYALGELHAVNVLELNNALSTINDLGLGKISGRKAEKEAKEKVLATIAQNTAQLDKRIQELERRANRILYTLSDR